MKIIVCLFSVSLLTQFAYGLCPENFEGVTVNGLYHSGYSDEPVEEFSYMLHTETDVILSESDFNKIPLFKSDFQYLLCKNSITKISFSDLETGALFTAYYTNDDVCDGGNNYGSIFNADGIYIADILDGDFTCLKSE